MFKNVPKALVVVLVCAILVGAGAGVANLAVSRAAGEAAVIGKVDGVRLGQEFLR